jgi:hypothetical protein
MAFSWFLGIGKRIKWLLWIVTGKLVIRNVERPPGQVFAQGLRFLEWLDLAAALSLRSLPPAQPARLVLT